MGSEHVSDADLIDGRSSGAWRCSSIGSVAGNVVRIDCSGRKLFGEKEFECLTRHFETEEQASSTISVPYRRSEELRSHTSGFKDDLSQIGKLEWCPAA